MFDSIKVQQMLTSLHYFHGTIDGNLSNPTFRAALKKFQADKGLDVDGWYGNQCDGALVKYDNALKTAGVTLEDMRIWRMTSYYVTDQSDYSGGNIPFVDRNFKTLVNGSADYFCDSSLEGTTKTASGLLLNVDAVMPVPVAKAALWADVLARAKTKFPNHYQYGGVSQNAFGSVSNIMTWTAVPHDKMGVGYGLAKLGIPYTPFKTVASDMGLYKTSEPAYKGKGGLVPAGTKVLIADLIGNKLPDGTLHDGWVIANDVGSAIFGAHFDMFGGSHSMAKQFKMPNLGHIWFAGIKDRIAPDYSWGLSSI
jgi:peptidoglycan hydrolase-like protein with peptidoglycan-binding domain